MQAIPFFIPSFFPVFTDSFLHIYFTSFSADERAENNGGEGNKPGFSANTTRKAMKRSFNI